jgi:hypothetical protein
MAFVVGAKDPSEGSIWSTYEASSSSGTSDGGGEGSGYTGDGTRRIYVSSSTGSDSNAGTQLAPKATLTGASGAKSLRTGRGGRPDWILLKRGDTWAEATQLNGLLNGRSANEPMILTCYGDEADPRPIIECVNTNGAINDNSTAVTTARMNYFAIMHIDFYASRRDPNNAAFTGTLGSFKAASTNNLVDWRLWEGCSFRFCQVVQQNDTSPFTPTGTVYFRNCVFTDCWPNSTVTGVFLHQVQTPVIENCYFDRVVWYNEVGTHGTVNTGITNPMSHSIYVQLSCGPGVYTNIFCSRSTDVQFRTAGPVRNVLLNGCTGGLVGIEGNCSTTSTTVLTTIRTGLDVEDCVVLKANDSFQATAGWDHRAYGIYVLSADGGHINNCIYAHTEAFDPTQPEAILIATPASRSDLPCTNTVATGNIAYNYQTGTAEVLNATSAAAGSSFSGTLDDRNGDNTEYSFLDPDNATLGKYLDSVTGSSGATDDDFYAAIRLQRKGNWNDALGMYCVIPYMKHRFARGTWLRATVA